jgi:circadian clock protein KaiC
MTTELPPRITTGIEGLDTVLDGGLFPRRSYLVNGSPGTGKTLVGVHFLTAGRDAGDTSLFVNLEEPTRDVRQNATALGFDLDGIEFLDLTPGADTFTDEESYTVFTASEVEGPSVAGEITEAIETTDPDRVFVDPVTQLRNLAPDDFQFRKQVTSFIQLLKQQEATVLFTSESTKNRPDDDLQYLSDGHIHMEHGSHGRRLTVPKFRGSDTATGPHTTRISEGGLTVYPQLTPGEYRTEFEAESISAGVPEVDELLNGGVERGTITVLSGPSGVGKSTLGTQFMKEAAGRGERSVVYLFEENTHTFLERSRNINIPVEEMRDRGTLALEEVEPLDVTAAEFASMVRTEVEENDAGIVMIDGIAGYRMSLRGSEEDLTTELHALGRYLKNMGVTVIFVDEVGTVTGEFQPTDSGVSYLADNLLFLRYLELQGELRKAIGVLKKRTSDFERTLREFEITEHGVKVGDPLQNLRGVLTGTPEFADSAEDSSTVTPTNE